MSNFEFVVELLFLQSKKIIVSWDRAISQLEFFVKETICIQWCLNNSTNFFNSLYELSFPLWHVPKKLGKNLKVLLSTP